MHVRVCICVQTLITMQLSALECVYVQYIPVHLCVCECVCVLRVFAYVKLGPAPLLQPAAVKA